MKLKSNVLNVLKHFSAFTSVITIKPNEHLYVLSESRFIYIRARIDHEIPKTVPIHDISLLVSLIKMFEDKEYTIEFGDDTLEIKTTDGKISQKFQYTKEDLISKMCPKKDKVDPKFDGETIIDFELSEENLKTIKMGIDKNKTTHVALKTVDGRLILTAIDLNPDGSVTSSNPFQLDLDVETTENIDMNFSSESFRVSDGSYTIGVTENFITLKGETLDYLILKTVIK